MRLTLSNSWFKNFYSWIPSKSLGTLSNPLNAVPQLFKGYLKSVIPCHFTLQNGEVFKIPSACYELQVLSGAAWISVAGKDIIVTAGERVALPFEQESALVSALGHRPLRLEVVSFLG
ncbi:MAG TPA: hypothetical protein V6C95_05290 [Coleofasciculaceae cyanobacterium]